MACDSRVYDAFRAGSGPVRPSSACRTPGGLRVGRPPRGACPSPYGESEGREEGGEGGERDVDDYAPAVLAFLGHNGFGWFGGFMSRSLRLM